MRRAVRQRLATLLREHLACWDMSDRRRAIADKMLLEKLAMRIGIWLTPAVLCSATIVNAAGQFKGELVLIPPGCEKQLECTVKNEFGYIDAHGIGWQAMAGLKTDGASIPPWAQPFIGEPFAKDFIRAAVIHDHYCKRHVRSWRTTHRVFYEALLTSSVSKEKALLMYYAVYLAGPKWLELIKGSPCQTGQNCIQRVPDFTWPRNTSHVRSQESGATHMVRQHQYDAPGFSAELEKVEKLIAEGGGNVTIDDLEMRAHSLRSNDFFYSNPDAVSVPAVPGIDQ